MTIGTFSRSANRPLDPAVAALWAAHPEGPPADVYEPREPAERALARAHALEWFGMRAAVAAFPDLFSEQTEGRGC